MGVATVVVDGEELFVLEEEDEVAAAAAASALLFIKAYELVVVGIEEWLATTLALIVALSGAI